jgi:hypothetical protein
MESQQNLEQKNQKNNPDPIVHVYPMKKSWQMVNLIIGIWVWLFEIINIIEFPLSLFIFKWRRKVLPAFLKMMAGEKRSYLLVSELGLKYRLWPWWEIKCSWDDVKKINKGRWLGDALFLQKMDHIGLLEFSISLGDPQIHLSSLNGWKKGGLEADLRKYRPQLFEKSPK